MQPGTSKAVIEDQQQHCMNSTHIVNDRVCTVLGMHCNTLYPDSSKIIQYVNEHVTQFRVRIGIHGTQIVCEIYM